MGFDHKKAIEVENIVVFWKPEKNGDELQGILREVRPSAMYGTTYILEDKEEVLHGTPSHTVLQAKMDRVPVGSEVCITYLGLGDAKPGMSAPKLYTVEYIPPAE